ncbi:MAG TPA: mechanosensitive ion channel domain-containing protein [Pyrinomonadaceae bacterium]|nr:mechanosensitive ion channel domain-containing protein [Pyrinomonadaceae bacterium]
MSVLLFGMWALWQEGENVLQRLWRWTLPLRDYLNFKWELGNFVFSIASLALGLAVFLLSFVLSRYLRTFLERRMQAHPHLDPGVQYTILRLVNYIVVLVGVIAALRIAVGADFTSLAVIFTALSVGIGFGLQFIAGDIAAGFLLLFERPVKVGDFVTVTGPDSRIVDGKVISINLRTTVVQNNDNVSVIVPNSKLTNENLINWSYRGKRSRLSINVGVSYDSDVELVTQTLLRAAEGVKFVLDEPKPSVQFMEFGESSLDFRLLVWTDRPRRYPQIRSAINYNIRRLFLEEKIEIPFPQRDLNLRGGALRFDPRDKLLVAGGDGGPEEPASAEEEQEAGVGR